MQLGDEVTALHQGDIGQHHLAAQRLELGGRLPAEELLRLGGVAQQLIHLRGPEVLRVHLHESTGLVSGVVADLVDTLALPHQRDADGGEGLVAELAHSVHLVGGQHEVVGAVGLQDAPHALHVVLGVPPVTLGVQVAQVQALLQALVDAGDGAGDLPRHEGGATARRLVVEQDAVAQEHVVALAVVLADPERELLGAGVGRAGVERGRLRLGHLLHLAVQLTGGGLVEAGRLLQPARADGVQDAERAEAVHVAGVLAHLERHLHVALGGQVVDLVGLDSGDDVAQVAGVGEVAVVQEDAW